MVENKAALHLKVVIAAEISGWAHLKQLKIGANMMAWPSWYIVSEILLPCATSEFSVAAVIHETNRKWSGWDVSAYPTYREWRHPVGQPLHVIPTAEIWLPSCFSEVCLGNISMTIKSNVKITLLYFFQLSKTPLFLCKGHKNFSVLRTLSNTEVVKPRLSGLSTLVTAWLHVFNAVFNSR